MTRSNARSYKRIWNACDSDTIYRSKNLRTIWAGPEIQLITGSVEIAYPDKTGIEAICDYFGIDDVELLGSEMKVRTFAYYKNDTLLAFGTMEEIAEQTGRKIESLRSLLCNSKRFNKTTKTYMIELEDDRRYKLKFKQSFTIDELNLKGIGWLLKSPLVEVEEVEE